MISKQKDTDRLVLLEIEDDHKLLEICKSNSELYYNICDEEFWRQRLEMKYPAAIPYKKGDTNWREWYLKVVYYVDEIKNNFGYKYKEGDPEKVYNYLENYQDGILFALDDNITDLVKFIFIRNNIRSANIFEYAMKYAGKYANYELVKFLIERAQNVLDYSQLASLLQEAVEGALSTRKYDFIKQISPDYYDKLVGMGYIRSAVFVPQPAPQPIFVPQQVPQQQPQFYVNHNQAPLNQQYNPYPFPVVQYNPMPQQYIPPSAQQYHRKF